MSGTWGIRRGRLKAVPVRQCHTPQARIEVGDAVPPDRVQVPNDGRVVADGRQPRCRRIIPIVRLPVTTRTKG